MSFFSVHVWKESVSFWWTGEGVEKRRKSHSVSILTFCPLNSTTNILLHLELSSKAAHYLLLIIPVVAQLKMYHSTKIFVLIL